MKVAVLSDIHANIEALRAVLAATRGRVERYLCLGDVVDYGANPNECIELLAEQPLLAVLRGNHDTAAVTGDVSRFRTAHGRESLAWTAARLTPASKDFLLGSRGPLRDEGLGIAAFHGGPLDSEWQYLFPSTTPDVLEASLSGVDQPLVFVGHSHLAFQFQHGGRKVVNPGSVGQPRNGNPDAQYAIADTATGEVALCQAPYEIGKAAEKIAEAGLDPFLARRLYLGI
jgi:predicted phosphodiesterase